MFAGLVCEAAGAWGGRARLSPGVRWRSRIGGSNDTLIEGGGCEGARGRSVKAKTASNAAWMAREAASPTGTLVMRLGVGFAKRSASSPIPGWWTTVAASWPAAPP